MFEHTIHLPEDTLADLDGDVIAHTLCDYEDEGDEA